MTYEADLALVQELVLENPGKPFDVIDLLTADGWNRQQAMKAVAKVINERNTSDLPE